MEATAPAVAARRQSAAPAASAGGQTLITSYAAGIEPALAGLAREYYAHQQPLLTAAAYLSLSPSVASENFLGNPRARELVQAPTFTTPQAEADFWCQVLTTWQENVQRQLDRGGRVRQLVAEWGQVPLGEVLVACYQAVHQGDSLVSRANSSAQQLAARLGKVVAATGRQPLAGLLGYLAAVARQVLSQSPSKGSQPDQLLTALRPELVALAQTLVLPTRGRRAALLSVAQLAQPTEAVARLRTLHASSASVRALAAWWQEQLRQFLQATWSIPVGGAPSPVLVRGQLRGAQGNQLAGYTLHLRQQVAGGQPVGARFPRDLATVQTDAQGGFTVSVARVCCLDAADAVAEVPTQVQISVYHPGQEAEPVAQFTQLLAADKKMVHWQLQLPVGAGPAAVADNQCARECSRCQLRRCQAIDAQFLGKHGHL